MSIFIKSTVQFLKANLLTWVGILTLLSISIETSSLQAQQYSGMSGLLQVPSGEMDTVGQVRLGAHFLNHHSMPKAYFHGDKKPYDTGSFYLSITPFKWVEIGYTMTLLKLHSWDDGHRYFGKDRYFSIKFQPLAEKEGKWWPAVAIGGQDVISSSFSLDQEGGFFQNYYVAATKTLNKWNQTFGITLAYRYYIKKANHNFNGIVGGIYWKPSFAPNFRTICEYAGGGQVNFGIDCVLWRHLMIQASLNRFKYFNGGLCYTVNLF